MLAIVSHDLHNRMNTIRLAAGLLEMDVGADKKQMQIDAIIRSVDRMTRLISDLLDVGAIEAGQFKVEPAPIRLSSMCEELKLLMQPQTAEKQQRFSCTVDAQVPHIMADQRRLLQALVNLVGNAIKFTPNGGRAALARSAQIAWWHGPRFGHQQGNRRGAWRPHLGAKWTRNRHMHQLQFAPRCWVKTLPRRVDTPNAAG